MADQKVSDLPSLNGADVDAADLLYIIDSSAGSAGSKKITVGQYQLAPVSGGTANGVMYLNGSKVATAGSDLVFDGSNLGVGTSSPGAKLEVVGAVKATVTPSNSIQSSFLLSNSAATSAANFQLNTSGGLAFWSFQSGGAGWFNSATLDTSGNLGLGVTPSAWTSGGKATVPNGGAFAAAGPSVDFPANAFFNGSWTYVTTNVASRYSQASGQHQWFTAPSGTAGTAIPFTQAMTLDASGQLGIGVTNPSERLDINGNMQVRASGYLLFQNSDNTNYYYVQNTGATGSGNPNLIFVQGGVGERARITSGGFLLVGAASPPSTTVAGFGVLNDANGTYLRNSCTITTTRTHFEFVNGNGTVGTINTNASATAYNTSSDRRLKENIGPAADAGPVIDAIEIVQHDWKVGGHTRFGVIAQDLNAVAPEAVSAGDDGDEIEKTWGVDYSKLVPMLIKEIQSLRARVAALESA